jgi:hypothetical protein
VRFLDSVTHGSTSIYTRHTLESDIMSTFTKFRAWLFTLDTDTTLRRVSYTDSFEMKIKKHSKYDQHSCTRKTFTYDAVELVALNLLFSGGDNVRIVLFESRVYKRPWLERLVEPSSRPHNRWVMIEKLLTDKTKVWSIEWPKEESKL